MTQLVTRPADSYDVVVLGGGFAGMAASRTLSRAGLTVLVVEGRDRLSGRMWTQDAFGDGHHAELGGAFMFDRANYPLTWQEIDAAALPLDWGSTEPTDLIWLTAGQRKVAPWPVPVDELVSLERLVHRIERLAAGIDPAVPLDQQDVSSIDRPWPVLLADLDLGPHTRDLWRAHVATMANDTWEVVSALPLLHGIAKVGSLVDATLFAAPYDTPLARAQGPQLARGTISLFDSVASGSSADVVLETVVESVHDDGSRVHVSTSNGVLTARAVVCALPISTLTSVDFDPGLRPELRTLAEQGVVGRAEKVTARVTNCDRPFYAHGITSDGGFATTSTTWHEGSDAIVVAFTAEAGVLPVDDRDEVQRRLREYVPGIVVEAVVTHDWLGDPFSRGTWSYLRPGQSQPRIGARRPMGRVTFAGSDFVPELGVEGALYSAELAAAEALALLDR